MGKPRSNGKASKPPTQRPKYQPLPDLPEDEFEALKRDIADHGVQLPIIQDELGNTLDGHQRQRAVHELRLKRYPIKVISGFSHEQKWEYALSVNIKRRHLTSAQKRVLIEQELLRTPDKANQWIADTLGVDLKTVQSVRRELEVDSRIPVLTKLKGRDGRTRTSEYRQVLANTAHEAAIAREVVGSLPPSNGKLLDITSASRQARRLARAEGRDERATIEPLSDDSIGIYHCPFQRLEEKAKLRKNSVDLILTDIPYGKDFLPDIAELGAFAARVLKDGGIFVTYSGQFHLPQVMTALGEHLTYRWVVSSTWPGNANMIHPYNLASQFKPILVFSKGKWTRTDRWSDVSQIDSREKDWHDWQQSLAEVETLVGYFSDPGDLVIDPCAGGFTTGVACRALGRRFVGCDSDSKCVRSGQQRLAEAV